MKKKYTDLKLPAVFFCLVLMPVFAVSQAGMVDPEATAETKALYRNLMNNMGKGVMFGHQDDLAYGVNWWEVEGNSDVKGSCGHYPAVFGWELSKLGQRPYNIDSVNFEKMKGWIVEGYKMGSVITLSWHLDNPVTGKSAWDKKSAVYSIVPGGIHHEEYKNKLDLFAGFIEDIRKMNGGEDVPILFRPFHEHTGNWFWWGDGNTSADLYTTLWKFTVHYLRDEKQLHNLIYVYSTDVFRDKDHYLKFYPGDDYVDVLAFDDYHGPNSAREIPAFTARLRTVCELAAEKNKVAALSETGQNQLTVEDWFTGHLLKGIKADPVGRNIAYVLVWRNADTRQFFAPYPGHSSQADFFNFYNDPYTWFQGDFPSLYK